MKIGDRVIATGPPMDPVEGESLFPKQGTIMTVVGIGNFSAGCKWFEGQELKGACFLQENLKYAEDEDD